MSVKNFIIVVLCFCTVNGCKQQSNPTLIRQLISKTFDRPGSKVETRPIVVVDNYAIADWTQDIKAGRALLGLKNGKWQLLLCGGKGLKNETTLVQSGVPATIASDLIKQLTAAEASLSIKQLQGFDDFGPSVNFSDTTTHPH